VRDPDNSGAIHSSGVRRKTRWVDASCFARVVFPTPGSPTVRNKVGPECTSATMQNRTVGQQATCPRVLPCLHRHSGCSRGRVPARLRWRRSVARSCSGGRRRVWRAVRFSERLVGLAGDVEPGERTSVAPQTSSVGTGPRAQRRADRGGGWAVVPCRRAICETRGRESRDGLTNEATSGCCSRDGSPRR
jgi:hypothetical protein